LSVAVRPLGPAGTYTVNYRVTSADGHVVSGSWSFELTVAGSGTPGAAASSPAQSDGGIVVWPFVLVAVALIGGGAWWAVRRRGQSEGGIVVWPFGLVGVGLSGGGAWWAVRRRG